MDQRSEGTEVIVAQQAMWIYTGTSEENQEKEFYAALEEPIAAELARHFQANEHIWVGREIHLRVGNYSIHARLTNLEPLLATCMDSTTKIFARYQVRSKDEGQDTSTFFAEVIRYPDEKLAAVFRSLVGLDAIKKDLLRKLHLILRPDYFTEWVTESKYKGKVQELAQIMRSRYPLFILEGEVGSGKTALARSIGSNIAARLHTEIVLFIINAQVRGGGHVGELTQNISRAFNEIERCHEREQVPVIALIDEADALAQARGGNQTHHEDDAGVNTLIQRIDRLRGWPIAVIFATNLVQSLDSAILRRASATYHFDRPSKEQRAELFRRILADIGVGEQTIEQLVVLTEPRALPGYGPTLHRYTYSDLSQRIIPYAIEEAIYTRSLLRIEHFINACTATTPTPESRGKEPL